MRFDWKADLAFALTGRQAMNHGAHIVGAILISVLVGHYAGDYRWAVFAVAPLKEWAEGIRKTILFRKIHVIDSVLDLLGWQAGAAAGLLL